MRHCLPTALLLVASFGAAAPVGAQAQAPDWVNRILAAARLPVEARDARREGVPDDEVRAVLDAMRRNRVPAHEAVDLLDTARAVRRQHGPVDNFGAFVQAQLASGKRGRDLAAAIRAEHARAGRGNAARGDASRGNAGQGQGRGRDDAARDTARGRDRKPDDRPGNAGNAGNKPANPGNKPDDRGRGNAGRPNRP